MSTDNHTIRITGILGGIFLVTIPAFALLNIPLSFYFIFCLLGIFFFIAFINTDLALILLIFSMLLSPEIKTGGIPGRAIVVRTDDILIGIVFLGWLAKMAIKKDLGFLRITSLNKPILIYGVLCFFSTALGVFQGRLYLKYSLFYLLKYSEYFIIFFMVANNLKTIKQARLFIFFMLLTCFFVCVYAWWQLPSGSRISAPFELEGGEPNTFAGYLLLMMAVTLGLFLHSERRFQRVVLFGLLAFFTIPFIFTLSRGGWLGGIAMLGTVIVIHRASRAWMIIGCLLFVILVPSYVPQKVLDRTKETFDDYKTYHVMGKEFHVSESAAARIDSWQIGFNQWIKNPVFGYGVPSGGTIDNQYTRVLTETGVIGFLVFLWLIMSVMRSGLYAYYGDHEAFFIRGVSLGFMAGLIGLLVQASTAAVFIIIRIMEPFWFCAAIVSMLPSLEGGDKNIEYEKKYASHNI